MSLVEIVIAIVILGGVISALVVALGTASLSSKNHRDLTTADRVLRNYAEAAKDAVRRDCTTGSTYTVSVDLPDGFTVNDLGTRTCPARTGPSPFDALQLTVTMPNDSVKALDVYVRTP